MCSSHYSLVSVSISWHVSFYFLKIFFYSSNLSHMYTMYLGHIVLLLFICFCMYWWFGCMKVYVSHACLVPLESRKQCQSPWFWSFKWLWATMWVCGIGLRSSRRVDSALNFWAISTAPKFPFQKILNIHPNIQVFFIITIMVLAWRFSHFWHICGSFIWNSCCTLFFKKRWEVDNNDLKKNSTKDLGIDF